jgi:hypothetical protein
MPVVFSVLAGLSFKGAKIINDSGFGLLCSLFF